MKKSTPLAQKWRVWNFVIYITKKRVIYTGLKWGEPHFHRLSEIFFLRVHENPHMSCYHNTAVERSCLLKDARLIDAPPDVPSKCLGSSPFTQNDNDLIIDDKWLPFCILRVHPQILTEESQSKETQLRNTDHFPIQGWHNPSTLIPSFFFTHG